MRDRYTSVYFRKQFVVTDLAEIGSLQLEALYDDGFVAWINGTNVYSQNVPGIDMLRTATAQVARESLSFETFNLPPPGEYLRQGQNVIAVHGLNSSLSSSSDFFMDFRLLASAGGTGGRGPTPGARNSVYSARLPPQLRQVQHFPEQPGTGQAVKITVKATDPDGVAAVALQYQIVEPGRYIELTAPAYQTNWASLPMNDQGRDGDEVATDSIYTVMLPGELQVHRRLVRYRIVAVDAAGQSITAPYADDPQPNFAYFVYDGLPVWRGAIQPSSTDPVRRQVRTFDANVLGRLPVYHLLTTSNSVMSSQYTEHYSGDAYKWVGTLVYDGEVYDHIHYRARGGVWRYSMGKNMWKFDFNRGHDFVARDNYGKKYRTGWTKLNLGACIQQGDYQHRGEQGMFEAVGFRLFNMVGVESSLAHFVHFRIIDEAEEASPSSQYRGDFWGLYLVVEQPDSRFLDEHGLLDGNLYKMEGGGGDLNNQGATAVTDGSDLNSFLQTYRSGSPSEAWWRTNFNVDAYYGYQAIVQGIHHYDICYQKNYFYYRNPATGVWSQHPWDLDLTWADNMFDAGCGGVDEFKNRVLPKPTFALEFKNRVREVRDLLFNTNQTWELIDEEASHIYTPGALCFVDADRAQWDYNPIMSSSYVNSSKAGQGRFYQVVPTKDFAGMVNKMKNYVVTRGTILDNLAKDTLIPAQPTLTYTGPTNFPVNRLVFRASPFSGSGAFAAMKWRLAEITDTNSPGFNRATPRHYEIAADWESPELPEYKAEIAVPPGIARVGHTYRARVRMKDNAGRRSRWSEPAQFVAGEPDTAGLLQDALRISELMFHPPAGGDYEFIELHNVSPTDTLDLGGAKFTAGIGYTFPAGAALAPGGYLLVVRAPTNNNFAAFRLHYGLSDRVPIVGSYENSLANGGETVTLKAGANGTEIVSFTYGDGRGWPAAADGAGHSLVPLPAAMTNQAAGALDYPANWRASAFIGGSPGQADPLPPPGVVLNEIMAATYYADPLHQLLDSNDWIELYNPTTAAVELTEWYLSDDPANLRKWTIPAVTVPPGTWLSFDEVSGFHQSPTNGFGLSKAGEQLFLSHLPLNGTGRVADAVSFKGQDARYSLGRYPDGGRYWQSTLPTRDAPNRLAGASVLITELMYHPFEPATLHEDSSLGEFVELANVGSTPVTLADTNGSWRLDGAVQYWFPPNATLPPGGVALVVSFSPADGTALANFKQRYGLTNQALVFHGPYAGQLPNDSGRVALERALSAEAAGEPPAWVIVDEVIYGTQDPWPVAADGLGKSLHRTVVEGCGSDPAGWQAADPSPGQVDLATPDRDLDADGLPDIWEQAHSLNPLVGTGPDGAQGDPDGDGLTNLQEYQGGTDPRALSVRILQLALVPEGLRLQFNGVANHSYRLESRNTLVGDQWQLHAQLGYVETTRVVEVNLPWPPEKPTCFFRVVLVGN
jgi:hypothetical protein